jgi:hypothetical protein
MFSANRRRFLRQASTAGIACSANIVLGRFLSAQTQTSNPSAVAKVYVDSRRTAAPLDRNLFGSFLEHLGRAIYEGIYDPGSKLADSNGLRKDVIDEIRQIGVPIVRYPGGPGRCAAGGRNSQFADPQRRPREAGVSGSADQRHRPDHDQPEWSVPADDLLSVQLGIAVCPWFRAQSFGRVSRL